MLLVSFYIATENIRNPQKNCLSNVFRGYGKRYESGMKWVNVIIKYVKILLGPMKITWAQHEYFVF